MPFWQKITVAPLFLTISTMRFNIASSSLRKAWSWVGSVISIFASTVGGREQIAIEAFADAVEVIPRTLAENAGLDPIDILIELRQQHKKGNKNAGINVFSGKVTDMKKENVIEPIRVGSQAISSATDAAVMVLRIDDVIAARSGGGAGPGAGKGGEGGDGGGEGEDF